MTFSFGGTLFIQYNVTNSLIWILSTKMFEESSCKCYTFMSEQRMSPLFFHIFYAKCTQKRYIMSTDVTYTFKANIRRLWCNISKSYDLFLLVTTMYKWAWIHSNVTLFTYMLLTAHTELIKCVNKKVTYKLYQKKGNMIYIAKTIFFQQSLTTSSWWYKIHIRL